MKKRFDSGNTLIIVLMISTILSIGILAIYSFLFQNHSTETRLYHQQQVIQLAQSTMNSYIKNKDTFLNSELYTGGSKPNTVTLPDESQLSFYSYIIDPNGMILEKRQPIPSTYEFVVEVFFGDENHNKKKDSGERLFYTKRLTFHDALPQNSDVSLRIGSVENCDISRSTITIHIQPSYGELEVFKAIREGDTYQANFSQTIDVSMVGNKIIDNEKNEASFKVDLKNVSQDVICLRAKAGSKTSSCQYLETPNNICQGLVIIIIDGQYIYTPIKNKIETRGKMIITSGVGNYSSSQDMTYRAKEGIVIEEGVTLTMSAKGQGIITVESENGDIIIHPSTKLVDLANGNNKEYRIRLNAPRGIIDIRGAEFESQRSILLQGKWIYADEAKFLLNKNKENVHFEFEEQLRVPKMTVELSKNNGSATSNPKDSNIICGTLAKGMLNNLSDYGICSAPQ